MLDAPKIELIKLQAEICKTLSDPKRLMLIHALREGEMSVSRLTLELGLPQANVSQHLAILRERGIVTTRREGTNIYYRLANEKIAQACDLVREVLADQLDKKRDLARSLRS